MSEKNILFPLSNSNAAEQDKLLFEPYSHIARDPG